MLPGISGAPFPHRLATRPVATPCPMPTERTPLDTSLDLDQLQLALDMSDVSVWRLDIATGLVHANAAGFRLLGLPPRPEGWHVEEMMLAVHPDDRAAMISAAHQSRISGQPLEVLARFRHEDGGWRQVLTRRMPIRSAAGELVAFFGMAIDVTGRLRAEQQLRDANQRIALIAHTTGIGTWEWHLPGGESRWDEQMFLLRGLVPRPQAPTIDEMTTFVHPDDRDMVSQQILRASAGSTATQYEFRIVRPDGEVRWLASRSVPVLDEQGRLARRIGVNWDITASREAEAQRQAKAVAERESEAKSELLARMSHELRTPLNAVLGFTELLLADDDQLDASARRARLEHIQSAGRHLLALINDVLELARPGSDGTDTHPLGRVPLDALFAESLPLVEGAAAQLGVTLRRDPCVPPGLSAMADPLWLKQVLLNLLTNAAKYNRAGGWVDLSARAAPGDRVCITVRDGGLGMSAEALQRAFEPFHRAAERQPGVPGVGIGLAVVKTLMLRMGGDVEVRSTLGQGSEFELWLGRAADEVPGLAPLPAGPVTPPPMPASTLAADTAPPPAPDLPLLLYVEDNQVNVMIVEELAARRPGLAFRSAPDGGSGLLAAQALSPTLILLDMQLPDMHGLDVLARLRADPATQGIPCIALSANALPHDIQQAMAAGFADYWTKPLDFAVFNRAIDTLFAQPSAGPPQAG